MNNEMTFWNILSTIADVLTLVSLIYAGIYGFINKTKTVLGHQIATFLVTILKLSFVLLLSIFVYKLLFASVYFFTILFLTENIRSDNLYWEKGYELYYIISYFIFFSIFFSLLWIYGSFIITGSMNHTKMFLNLFLPVNKRIHIKHFKYLYIIRAEYGADSTFIDITEKLKKMIDENTLTITASNSINGDPAWGKRKKIKIEYQYSGEEAKNIECLEGETITIEPT